MIQFRKRRYVFQAPILGPFNFAKEYKTAVRAAEILALSRERLAPGTSVVETEADGRARHVVAPACWAGEIAREGVRDFVPDAAGVCGLGTSARHGCGGSGSGVGVVLGGFGAEEDVGYGLADWGCDASFKIAY